MNFFTNIGINTSKVKVEESETHVPAPVGASRMSSEEEKVKKEEEIEKKEEEKSEESSL